MLVMTGTAAEVVKAITSTPEAPDGAGLPHRCGPRVASQAPTACARRPRGPAPARARDSGFIPAVS